MKPATLLATLVGLAVLGGLLLVTSRQRPAADAPADPALSAADFVARELGVAPAAPAPLQPVDPAALQQRIATQLEARFGPEGLERRSRAYAYLTLLPPEQDLEALLVLMESAGTRAWFDPHTGTSLVVEDFSPESRPDDRAALLRLRTRETLYREGFRLPPEADDDRWITHHILHGAVALAVAEAGSPGTHLPTSEETDREATLLSLPVFVLNLAQSPEFVGLPYLRERRERGTGAWLDILRTAPPHTHGLLGLTTDPLPPLPAGGATELQESLGAYATQLLLERHADYERAEELILDWRGDHFRMFTNPRGEHLVWNCRWASPAAAAAAADLLRNTLTVEAAVPGTQQRSVLIDSRGDLLRLFNCADPATLATLSTSP